MDCRAPPPRKGEPKPFDAQQHGMKAGSFGEAAISEDQVLRDRLLILRLRGKTPE
jgi:hypothetical protein